MKEIGEHLESNVASSKLQVDTVSGASESVAKTSLSNDLKDNYDVIVIGGGGAGMAAAISAKDAGSNVVILEKMSVLGGNTSKASAGMNASQTRFQQASGIQDSNDLFYEETLAGGYGTNNPDLVRYLVDHSSEAIEWLDSMGMKLNNLTVTGGMSVKRTHRPEDGSAIGGYLVAGLKRNLLKRKIPTIVNATVKKINQTEGVVTGVQVLIEGQVRQLSAKAVIITTGGFGGNLDMVKSYNSTLSGFVSTNHKGATGDGIVMGEEAGASLVDMDQIQIHPSVEQEKTYLITEAVRGEGAILVNQEGLRFTNELDTRDVVSKSILTQPDGFAYLIFDYDLRDRVKAVNQYDTMGLVTSADSIEGLETELGIESDVLVKTLELWNKSVENGKDDSYSRSTGMAIGLENAPYYAIKVAPGIHHTMGGLKINSQTEVLNESNQAIVGLYAAGEAAGGVHGANRIGGNAIADIIIFGRLAGTQAAKN